MKSILLSSALAALASSAWAGPKGAQYLAGENLQDEKTLAGFVKSMTDDAKGKHFAKISKVVIPTYYLEFRTASSGKALKKGLKDISVNATVTYANPDKAVMESIATEGLADLKSRFAAAGYTVVEPGDIKSIDRYAKITTIPSGTIGESTAQPIGWARFKAMFASAGGEPFYVTIPGETGWGPMVAMAAAGVDGTVWKNAGGEGVGVIRSRMLIDFVTFIGDTGKTYVGNNDTTSEGGWKNYASISAVPQVQVWLPSLCATRTYIFWGERILADNMGCVNVNGEIQLASKITGDALGKLGDKGDQWTFTADNAKFKEAALEQIKIANALLVGKAKTFKK